MFITYTVKSFIGNWVKEAQRHCGHIGEHACILFESNFAKQVPHFCSLVCFFFFLSVSFVAVVFYVALKKEICVNNFFFPLWAARRPYSSYACTVLTSEWLGWFMIFLSFCWTQEWNFEKFFTLVCRWVRKYSQRNL